MTNKQWDLSPFQPSVEFTTKNVVNKLQAFIDHMNEITQKLADDNAVTQDRIIDDIVMKRIAIRSTVECIRDWIINCTR